VLSLKRYGWLCVLGGEVAYVICILGGYRTDADGARDGTPRCVVRNAPGFNLGSPWSLILGAVYVFAFVWIFGAYMVWMHNTSLIKQEGNQGHATSTGLYSERTTAAA
jgi:hypothetical protein